MEYYSDFYKNIKTYKMYDSEKNYNDFLERKADQAK